MVKTTQSFEAASPAKELPLSRIRALMKAHGLNSSLPCAVFDQAGVMVGANQRMKGLLNSKVKLPIEVSLLESSWPFHNETDAGPALLRKAISHRDAKNSYIVLATAHLKTFKLQTILLAPDKKAQGDSVGLERLLVAEIVRSGDLLGDRDSRQVLFRTLSHEIRTSVMAMNGYLGIIDAQIHDVKVVQESNDRLKALVKRLESVVVRLDEFRVELGVLESQKTETPVPAKRK